MILVADNFPNALLINCLKCPPKEPGETEDSFHNSSLSKDDAVSQSDRGEAEL